MKIKSLALLICSALCSSATFAESLPRTDAVWEGSSSSAIMVKMKAAASLTRQSLPSLLDLNDAALNVSAPFQHAKARGTALDELQTLDKKYGFDRYLRIAVPADKTRDTTYINNIINELKANPHVEAVYPEFEASDLEPETETRDIAATAAVADYRARQHYVRAPNDIIAGYRVGGVNRDSVSQYAGSDGANVTVLSHEIGQWNQDHINLPKAVFATGTSSNDGNHGTAAVGIMAARDIGTGIKGLAWNSQVAYAPASSYYLYNAIPRLQAGDVVQIGFHYSYGGEVTGCTSKCYLPAESNQANFDIIKALTDKGVHVIEAASNGNINLDHSAFNGQYNIHTHDSGAIFAGGIEPLTGGRASFSNYGSRVTSASWGRYVVTTGYGGLASGQNADYTATFNGTSASNPIIAGVVASLSSIAKAHGITVTPRQMRDILNQTGTQLNDNASALIGTQPDMARAVAKILELDHSTTPAPVITVDHSTINAISGTTAWSYPLIATSDQESVNWQWKFLSGDSRIYLNSSDSNHTLVVIPANVSDAQAKFEVTAINSSGKSTSSVVTINVAKAAVTVTGAVSMADDQPVKLQAQANFEQASYTWRLLNGSLLVIGGIDQNGQMSDGLLPGDYVAEVTAVGSVQGIHTATTTHNIKVTSVAQNTDAAFINDLKMTMSATDNGSSVTFNGSATSGTAATSTPTYNWALPAGAQGSGNGLSSQRFTINKTSQVQTLSVNVTVNAGNQSRVLTQTITVPAKEVVNTDAAFINGLKMALSSTDNGSSITFNGSATSGTAATSTPTYRWALPAGAQGSNSGLATQSFTVNKTSQAQTLSLNVTVNAGSQSRVLTQTLTVPALVNTGGYPAWAFGTAYKTGDIVSHKGKNYKCTVGSWCAQNGQYSQLHYEPGVGLSWGYAWKLN